MAFGLRAYGIETLGERNLFRARQVNVLTFSL